jgi:hypothetical protein
MLDQALDFRSGTIQVGERLRGQLCCLIIYEWRGIVLGCSSSSLWDPPAKDFVTLAILLQFKVRIRFKVVRLWVVVTRKDWGWKVHHNIVHICLIVCWNGVRLH